MPLYEFICRGCRSRFEELLGGGERATCPDCGSRNVRKLLSVFAVGGSSPAGAHGGHLGPCGTCGDPRGPGACDLDAD